MARPKRILKIPADLERELDRIVGHKQRSANAAESLSREVRRSQQRAALKLSSGCWSPEDHPELAAGGAAYVEQLRRIDR